MNVNTIWFIDSSSPPQIHAVAATVTCTCGTKPVTGHVGGSCAAKRWLIASWFSEFELCVRLSTVVVVNLQKRSVVADDVLVAPKIRWFEHKANSHKQCLYSTLVVLWSWNNRPYSSFPAMCFHCRLPLRHSARWPTSCPIYSSWWTLTGYDIRYDKKNRFCIMYWRVHVHEDLSVNCTFK